MSRKFKIYDQDYPHFVTFTVINWFNCFASEEFINIFLNSIKYCQRNKGLKVYGWCIMTNHVHMIIGTHHENKLINTIRDLKSYTSRKYHQLFENKKYKNFNLDPIIYETMKKVGQSNGNNRNFQFWQQHNHPIELSSNFLIDQKLDYIHENPVKAGFVYNPEEYIYSSACDYYDTRKGLLDLEFI